MRSLLCSALGIVGLLAAASPLYAQQKPPKFIIPASNIERTGDIGVRAHTNMVVVNPASGFHPLGGLGPGGGMTPAQIQQAYLLPSSGGSQIIAIVDALSNPDILNNFNTFANEFGLPQETSTNMLSSSNTVFQVVYAQGSQPAQRSDWGLEEALDVEWAHAMAPNAKIVLFEAADNSYTNLLGAIDVATGYTDANCLTTQEESNSWGGGESSDETGYDSHFTSTSVTYFASSGDSGAGVIYPSASPYVIAAGGTTLHTDSSGNFTGETGWSGSGGGPSSVESRPSYQDVISSIVGSARGVPDISYVADPNSGASVYDQVNGGWLVVGGTSWSSPGLAGIHNLASTSAGSFSPGSQAELSMIYGGLGTANFRDITSGSNGYSCQAGWDFVTGVGSVQGLDGLAVSSTSPVIYTLSPNSANVGSSNVTVTVNGKNYDGGAVVNWNGAALSTAFLSSTQLTATIPASDLTVGGVFHVTVTDNSITSNTAFFTVKNPVPSTSSISPTSAYVGSGSFTLTVNGSNFGPGSVVYWGNNALTTTFVSGSQLTASVPASDTANVGTASITVFNPSPGGGTSNAQTFTINSVPSPVLSKISPTSVLAGGPGFTLTVTGSGFINTSKVDWTAGGSTSVLSTTYVSSTQLSASVPASLIASAGSAKVVVSTPGAGTSSSKTIKILQTALSLSVTSLVKNSDGSYTATISLNNIGYLAANNTQITSAKLGLATTSTPLPVSVGNIPAGSSGSASLSFPAAAGVSGKTVTLKVVSSFTGGTSTNSIKVKLPQLDVGYGKLLSHTQHPYKTSP